MGTFFDLLNTASIDGISLGCSERAIIEKFGEPHDISGKIFPFKITRYGIMQFGFTIDPMLKEYSLDSVSIYFEDERYFPSVLQFEEWTPNYKTKLSQLKKYVLSRHLPFVFNQKQSYDEFRVYDIGLHITTYFRKHKKRRKNETLYLLSIHTPNH
jgi:hypothetical protein